jgi:hypothetical protein
MVIEILIYKGSIVWDRGHDQLRQRRKFCELIKRNMESRQ